MSVNQVAPAKVKAKASMTAAKIHGPNSPDVLEGRVQLGFREEVAMDEPEQVLYLTYEQVVEMFGQGQADVLFKEGATE